jgi:tyrocidine synthetase-3
MKIDDYISDLRNNKNIIIAVLNDEIKIRGNKEALNQELIAEIKSKKGEILAYFKSLKGYELAEQIPKAPEADYFGLSSAQRRLYFLHELEPESVAYNQPIFVSLIGNVDKERLEQTFNSLIVRHEILRTSFINVEGEIFQQINAPNQFKIEHFTSTENGVDAIVDKFIRPFDLKSPCLLRVGLIEVTPTEFVLLTDAHHIISDGVSQGILISEFMNLYSNEQLPDLRLQYKDYAHWQVNDANRQLLSNKKEFWLAQFTGDLPLLDLPTDRSRPAVKSYAGDTVDFEFNELQTLQLKRLAEKNGTTMFTVLLTAFYVLLYKLSSQEDIVIGTPTAGREHLDLEEVIGVFVNTLALRNYPKGTKTFKAFLAEVKATTLACFDNQAYQYEELINELNVPRDKSRNPLFDTIFTYQNYAQPEVELSELTLKPYKNVRSESLCDMHITAFERFEIVDFNFTYPTELYERETIERFATYFKNIVSSVIEDEQYSLSEIDIISVEEQHRILHEFNHTDISYPKDETIISLFEKQATKTPDKIAVRYEEHEITYKELEEQSGQLATYLHEQGLKSNDFVGVFMDRSIEMMVTILAIQKAGGTYVPIDPDYPRDRIKYMVEDSIVQGNTNKRNYIITQEFLKNTLEEIVPEGVEIIALMANWEENTVISNIERKDLDPVSPNGVAYIIYTSGSTGKPKGVMVEHRNVVSLLKNEKTHFDFNENDVWTMFHSYCFDFSVWEMYGALLFGGELIMVSKEITKDPKLFANLLFENGVTVLNQTPQAFYVLQESYVSLFPNTKIRYVIFGGEALNPLKLRTWHTSYPGTKLINMYGITETTVHVTYKEIGVAEINSGLSNIGTALPTLHCYILNEYQKPVPIGVHGELFVSGAGVARGYLNREDLSLERFIQNPSDANDSFKVYRTGDKARWLANGDIEYLGRIDDQVKVRGYRIELGEIEATLNEFFEIEKSVVIAKMHAGNNQLIAYCKQLSKEKELDLKELRAHLSKSLPDYMIPAFILPIDEIPITSNGKVDRKKLSARELEINSSNTYVPPATEIERLVTDIWKEALAIPKIGVKDNFFTLGGDSIKAIKLIYKINDLLGSDLHVADMYAHQTIEELSAAIPHKSMVNNDALLSAEAEISDFQKWYKNEVGFHTSYEEVYPMSGIEKGMTFYTLLKDKNEDSFHNIIYHEQNLYSIPFANFKFDVFKKAILLLMEKHSTMRKVYDVEYFTHIIKKEMEPVLKYIDISHLSMEEQQQFGLDNKDQERVKSTDFSGEVPLWRMSVIKTREDYHYLLFDMHHSVLDGWSLYSFLTELKNTYVFLEKDPEYVPEKLECDYYDQILGELTEINKGRSDAYWRNELSDYNRYTFFQTGQEHKYMTEIHDISLDLKKDLETLASSLNTSLKHLCFAAYIYTLTKFNYVDDFVVGIITNTRPLVPDGERLLGCFLNAVPFRADTSEVESWRTFINYIDDKLVKMKRHEKIPLQKILEIIEEPAMEGNPLFDTTFNFVDFWIVEDIMNYEAEIEFDHHTLADMDFATDNLDVNQNTLFDFHIWSDNKGFQMILEYSTAILSEETILKFHTYFTSVLESFVKDVEGLTSDNTLISEEEKVQLLSEFNDTKTVASKESTIISLFEEQALKTPDQIAVRFADGSLTYKELQTESNKIANYLQIEEGVGVGDLVGVMLSREKYLLPTIFGIMKAGAAYVPLDPKHPASRTNLIIKDSKLKKIITRENLSKVALNEVTAEVIDLDQKIKEIEKQEYSTFESKLTNEDLAYVIYTSGSAGNPKGVMIQHKSVVNFIDGIHQVVPFEEGRTIACMTTISFDIFALESLLPLCKGLTIILVNEEEQQDAKLLSNIVKDHQIELLQLTPSRLELLLTEDNFQEILKPVKSIMIGGEAFPEVLFKKLKKNFKGKIFNMYGPTETTVWSTVKELTESTSVNIGQPINNTEIYILGKNNDLLSFGAAGELCIGGLGLAKGYLHNEKLTNEKFVPHPYVKGERIYKTGDLARWLPSGDLEFLGRIDNQVKIRGYRIELGEIESQLNNNSKINQSIVLAREHQGEKLLVAFYTSHDELDSSELRGFLGEKLPEYMLPSYFIYLDEFPLSPSGKIDRRAFPTHKLNLEQNYEGPIGEIEEKLVELWAEVLKTNEKDISVTTNFFEMGGHSLRAMVLINKMNKEFSIELSLTVLFRMTTVRDLALFLRTIQNKADTLSMDGNSEEFSF